MYATATFRRDKEATHNPDDRIDLSRLATEAVDVLKSYFGVTADHRRPEIVVDQGKLLIEEGRASYSHKDNIAFLPSGRSYADTLCIVGEEVGHWLHCWENPELFRLKDAARDLQRAAAIEFDAHRVQVGKDPKKISFGLWGNFVNARLQYIEYRQVTEFVGAIGCCVFADSRERGEYARVFRIRSAVQRKGLFDDIEKVNLMHKGFLGDTIEYNGDSRAATYYNQIAGLTPHERNRILRVNSGKELNELLKELHVTD